MSLRITSRWVRVSMLVAALLVGNALMSNDAQAGVAVRSMTSVCGWEQLDWSQMSGNEQQLWSRLGWTQVSWDSGQCEVAGVRIEGLGRAELSGKRRRFSAWLQCSKLGDRL